MQQEENANDKTRSRNTASMHLLLDSLFFSLL